MRLLDAGPVSAHDARAGAPGAHELMDLLRARGVTVSCGHSNATAAEARDAFAAGRQDSDAHLQRDAAVRRAGAGPRGAALVTADVVVQVILDGVHLADETARLVWQAAGGRVALVTDAIAAAGCGRRQLHARPASTSRWRTASRGGPTACSRAARSR